MEAYEELPGYIAWHEKLWRIFGIDVRIEHDPVREYLTAFDQEDECVAMYIQAVDKGFVLHQ